MSTTAIDGAVALFFPIMSSSNLCNSALRKSVPSETINWKNKYWRNWSCESRAERRPEPLGLDSPDGVHATVDQDDRDLFGILGGEFGVVEDVLLVDDHAGIDELGFGQHAVHCGTGVVAQVAARLGQEGDLRFGHAPKGSEGRLAPGHDEGPRRPVVGGGLRVERLLLVATLVTSLAKQLAVLLLRHALATLLDDRTHRGPH